MRTRNYKDNLKDILTLCRTSKSALIIAEINDYPTRINFESDLFDNLSVVVLKYQQLNTDSFLSNLYADNFAFVLTGSLNEDDNIAEYLNINRDFYLNITLPVIFVLPSFAVDSLISFSSSFWSCVSLHKKFVPAFHSLLQPRFMDSIELGHATNMSLSYVLGQSIYIENRKYLKNFLQKEWQRFKDINEPNSFFRELNGIISYYYLKKKYFYVIDCCSFVVNYCGYDLKKSGFLFAFSEYHANSLYHIGEYRKALEILNYVQKWSKDFDEVNSSQASRFLNNMGVLLMIDGGFTLAESMFKRSSSLETHGISLYNLSLLAYNVGQINSALNTIQVAKSSIPMVDSDSYKIAIARMQVLEAYIQINRGNCQMAKRLLQVSLNFFRNTFDESCLYVLETHYTNALVFLYEGDYTSALKCAKSSYSIATKLKAFSVRPYISELVGEIYFSLNDPTNACKYFSEALQKNNNNKYFEKDVAEWIMNTIEICTKD